MNHATETIQWACQMNHATETIPDNQQGTTVTYFDTEKQST
jgi:hypothetical protein